MSKITVNSVMDGITPSTSYEGIVVNDDFVLAIDDGTATSERDYLVLEEAVVGVSPTFNTGTSDKTYLRRGTSSTKTSTQRQFAISGDRFIGDDTQDYIFELARVFGLGQACITNYVYFNRLTGAGEKGQLSIIVNNDGGGNAGDPAEIDVAMNGFGSIEEYTYTAAE